MQRNTFTPRDSTRDLSDDVLFYSRYLFTGIHWDVGGVYLVDLLNVYGPGLAILFVVFAEAAGVFWVYGVDRFSEDVRSMLGHTPGWFWRVCWAYISPVFLLVLFVFSLLAHEEMLGQGEYQYPPWSITVGWIMTGTTVSCIPLYIIYKLIITPGSLMTLALWLSCNGEVWGVGPTAVFASAAALFLFNELEASLFVVGDHINVSLLEKTLVSTMVLGMLALMIHLWVCSMRFFQYYLDTLIRDSPNMLLEMTTAGLLGGSPEMVALGPLTRFLRTQQPQIHITLCWFLALCYADYVRKNYCQQFNMPYLEQWLVPTL
ncbi:Transporter, partial [Operophtera brumata]